MDLQQELQRLVAKDMNIQLERHQLCSLCRLVSESGIVRGLLLDPSRSMRFDDEEFPYHKTKEDMIKAVLEGCHICAFVEDRCGDALMFPSSLHLWSDFERYIAMAAGPLKEPPDGGVPPEMIYYSEEIYEHGPWRTPDQASLYTGSTASLAKARDWLLQCQKNHSSCRLVLKSSKSRPRRLLEVGKNSGSTIRVCLSESLTGQSELEYLTLSHCWGEMPVIRLRESDRFAFEALHRSIPFNSLPLTFQHAVTITRTLGFEYLWIDSLCIIQDSEQDWIEQSATMGAIYRGGVCNIAATSSKDSRGGCFVTRNPLLYTPCILHSSGIGSTVLMVPRSPPTNSGPLSSRAWVFQERILSPRTLHFGPNGIDWECMECYESSTAAGNANLKQTLYKLKSQVTPPFDFRISPVLWSFLDSWAKILSTFSSCKITYPKDRLVAFNGIVEEASRKSGFTSVAGLWKEVLPLELLWRRFPRADSDASGNNDVTKVYVAPSWSWAACNEGIWPYYFWSRKWDIARWTSEISLRVLEISVTAKPNGLVLPGAQLRVSGPTRRYLWSECCIKREEYRYLDDIGVFWYLDQSPHDLEEVHLLLIARLVDDYSVGNFPTIRKIDNGLMLQQVNDQPSEFRRVGLFSQAHYYDHKVGYDEKDGLLFPSSFLDSIETFTII